MTGRKRALHAWVALLLASSSATALEVQAGSEDFTLQVDPLIQPRIQVDFDGPPGGAAPSGHANIDFYIRRARLLVRGTAYKHFSFGINIVALRVGERGNLNVTPFLQDLVVGYMPATDVHVETLVQQRYQAEQLPEDSGRGESVPARPPRQDPGGVREHHRELEPRDDAGAAPVHRAGPTRLVMRQSAPRPFAGRRASVPSTRRRFASTGSSTAPTAVPPRTQEASEDSPRGTLTVVAANQGVRQIAHASDGVTIWPAVCDHLRVVGQKHL